MMGQYLQDPELRFSGVLETLLLTFYVWAYRAKLDAEMAKTVGMRLVYWTVSHFSWDVRAT